MTTTTAALPDESLRPTLRSTRFGVEGMTCGHCERAVEREALAIAGVRSVVADATAGTVILKSVGPVEVDVIAAAVDEAGYRLAR